MSCETIVYHLLMISCYNFFKKKKEKRISMMDTSTYSVIIAKPIFVKLDLYDTNMPIEYIFDMVILVKTFSFFM